MANLYGADVDREGTCELCGAACHVINGVATHADGWRDDECSPSAAQVVSSLTVEQVRNIVTAEGSEWAGSTVAMAMVELDEARKSLLSVEAALTGTNAYADGPRRDLDSALNTLFGEIARREQVWAQPVRDEREELREQAHTPEVKVTRPDPSGWAECVRCGLKGADVEAVLRLHDALPVA
jgi:hypothetical protein